MICSKQFVESRSLVLRQCDFSPIAFSLSSLCCSNASFAKKRSHVPRSPLLCMEFFKDSPRRGDIKWTSSVWNSRKQKKAGKGRTSKIGAWRGPLPRARIWRKKMPIVFKEAPWQKIRAPENQKGSPQIKAAEKQLFFPKKTDLQYDERKLIKASFLEAKCKCGARLSKKRMLRTWEFFFGPRGKRTPKGEEEATTTSFAPISPLSSLSALGQLEEWDEKEGKKGGLITYRRANERRRRRWYTFIARDPRLWMAFFLLPFFRKTISPSLKKNIRPFKWYTFYPGKFEILLYSSRIYYTFHYFSRHANAIFWHRGGAKTTHTHPGFPPQSGAKEKEEEGERGRA